ncbi:hypothetical protein LOTGIDRAFT_166257 [Lottia gigantea]|uniref:Uncharacterized protein n=1 Tax=Lottia gigantea TaxID=225164 RepID=V3Z9Q9_LOTGI|nr:hypothetical protein LOTGIDRAFT_166257 [Lottia gigantea]ESO87678.1 hypothetical protein LOTGIDRAFT_166257 [Lottia gigantea]
MAERGRYGRRKQQNPRRKNERKTKSSCLSITINDWLRVKVMSTLTGIFPSQVLSTLTSIFLNQVLSTLTGIFLNQVLSTLTDIFSGSYLFFSQGSISIVKNNPTDTDIGMMAASGRIFKMSHYQDLMV